jgi:hypothetical protein
VPVGFPYNPVERIPYRIADFLRISGSVHLKATMISILFWLSMLARPATANLNAERHEMVGPIIVRRHVMRDASCKSMRATELRKSQVSSWR